jgi:hypothetical protein
LRSPSYTALDALYDLHARLDAAGWVEGDFYDGALLYDFDAQYAVLQEATTTRYPSYDAFHHAWSSACVQKDG